MTEYCQRLRGLASIRDRMRRDRIIASPSSANSAKSIGGAANLDAADARSPYLLGVKEIDAVNGPNFS